MKGIIGKKLGMTQIFDPETGAVTPVTVIAAGPCPVVQVKTAEVDGYVAVQLAFDPVPARKLSNPELGHLKRHGVAPHRTLVEFRGGIEGAVTGEAVTVELFQPGDNTNMDIELIQPIAMDQGLRFAIREGGRTVGAGVVTDIIK